MSKGGRTNRSGNRARSSRSGVESTLREQLNKVMKEVRFLKAQLKKARRDTVVQVRADDARKRGRRRSVSKQSQTVGPKRQHSNRSTKGQPGGSKQIAQHSGTLKSAPSATNLVSSSTPAPSTATPVVKKPPLRKMPKVGGKSRDATLRANGGELSPEDPQVEMPVKVVEAQRIDVSFPPKEMGKDLRSRNPKGPVLVTHHGKFLPVIERPRPKRSLVDNDLVHRLRYEFALEPRTTEVMRRMVAKGKRYIESYDLGNEDWEGWYNVLLKAVEAAMHVPIQEANMRQRLQDFDDNEIRKAHASFVVDGSMGRAAVKTFLPFFGGTKEVTLPGKPKKQ